MDRPLTFPPIQNGQKACQNCPEPPPPAPRPLLAQACSDFSAFSLDDVDAAFSPQRFTTLRYQQDVALTGGWAGGWVGAWVGGWAGGWVGRRAGLPLRAERTGQCATCDQALCRALRRPFFLLCRRRWH